MRKFECNSCEADCELTMQMDELTPSYCLYDKEKANWHEVKEENTQQFGNSEQLPSNPRKLPDWFKVGEYMYLSEKGKYFKITEDFMNVNLIGEKITAILAGKIKQAKKRPFNEAEMKALVGKVLRGDKFDYCALITYTEAEMIETQHYTYTSDELIDGYTIDGKPCFKLEHLNDKGEWVE